MATNKICDVCNDAAKQPVRVVRVAIDVVAAVDAEGSTGCAHEIESCEGCWPVAMADIAANVQTQLLRAIPAHREVYRVNAAIVVACTEQRDLVRKRDAMLADNPDMPKITALIADGTAKLSALETERLAVLEGAQLLSA